MLSMPLPLLACRLELPLLRLDSSSDVPDAVCQPGMQPVTPRGLCKPLGSHASEQDDTFCKRAAGRATASASAPAAASRLPLAFSLQLALLPLLMAGVAAVIGPPVKVTLLGSSPLAAARSWWIACSCSGTLLLLCTHPAYARLGWRVGALIDLLWLALRGGAASCTGCLLACLPACIAATGCCLAAPGAQPSALPSLLLPCCTMIDACGMLQMPPAVHSESPHAFNCAPTSPHPLPLLHAAARSHSLLLFTQGAAALLACRLLLAGCAIAARRQTAAAAKSPITHIPDLHMHQWSKA